jgi:hypothetical protein
MSMDFRTWYDALAKPAWTPPPGTIGLITDTRNRPPTTNHQPLPTNH